MPKQTLLPEDTLFEGLTEYIYTPREENCPVAPLPQAIQRKQYFVNEFYLPTINALVSL